MFCQGENVSRQSGDFKHRRVYSAIDEPRFRPYHSLRNVVLLKSKEQMKVLALAAIKFYQRKISPHKGFCCAYAAYTSDASCSALGYRAIRRFGVWDGLIVLDRRLARCGMAHRITSRARPMVLPMPKRRQAGHVDCSGCDASGCDAIGCDTPLSALDGCAGCSCDWPTRRGSANGFRKGTPDNEEAVKRRSRLLREGSTPTDPPA